MPPISSVRNSGWGMAMNFNPARLLPCHTSGNRCAHAFRPRDRSRKRLIQGFSITWFPPRKILPTKFSRRRWQPADSLPGKQAADDCEVHSLIVENIRAQAVGAKHLHIVPAFEGRRIGYRAAAHAAAHLVHR